MEADESTDIRDSDLDEEDAGLSSDNFSTPRDNLQTHVAKQKAAQELQTPSPISRAEIQKSDRLKTRFHLLSRALTRLHVALSNFQLAIVFIQCSMKENCWDFLRHKEKKSDSERGC